MAEGDLITGDYELEYRNLLLGGSSSYGIASIDGLADLPAIRFVDTPRLQRDGLRPGNDYLGQRTVTLSIDIHATSDADLATKVEALQTAFRPGLNTEEPLVFQIPGLADGQKARVNCRVRKRSSQIGQNWLYRYPRMVLQLSATDPRIYSNTLNTDITSLPTSAGGRTYPKTYPLVYGAVSTGGTISAVNSGSYSTPVQLRIDGPVTDPKITNTTTGDYLSFKITVDSGDYLLVDTATRTVLLNGTASRYSSLDSSSRWFDLEPGTNQLDYSAITFSSSTLTASWRSAWV